MKEATAKRVVAKLNENEIEATLYEGYSGRCMFGEKTTGVVLRNSYDTAEAKRLCPRSLGKARQDSMGYGTILY